ncbi:hypothetical protein H9W90_02320 [Polaribacter pectinis]|uniref:Uncharacterized protein n=1 Tax=Polaribacter pectinis TaxID=2738844 RepID=A0A7G9LBH3_9FLAO|nr:hypothetical protein [Polaribacter pectinis]QNM85972.1 hypothetical protein H9W90_02320 [Polaribacter pectinis]
MKQILLLFIVYFFIPIEGFSQQLQEPNYPNCSSLREKNENYAAADGKYTTWCEMKKQTPYVRCQCKREQMMANFKKQIDDLNDKIEQVNKQASSYRSKYDSSYKDAQDYKGKLYEDDNSNFESDRQNALRFLKISLQNKEQQLKYLEESKRLNDRKPSYGNAGFDYKDQSIRYAKDAIENLKKEIEEVTNKQKKQKLSISFGNNNSNSSSRNSSSNSNSSNNNANRNQNNSNSNTYQQKYQSNNIKNSNSNNRKETYQQKQARLQQEKKNREIEENNRRYKAQLQRIEANKRFHAKMESYSKNAMAKFDQAAQGDLLAAGIMKGSYAIAMASQGYTDKTAIVGAATNIIGGLLANAERKRAEEARLAAIEAEKRKREAAKRKFIAKLVKNRKLTLTRMPGFKYPSFLTNNSSTSVFFFAMIANEEKLKEDLPEIKITDIVEVARYSDGTWPSENTFKEKMTKYGSYDVRIFGAFTNYNIASKKLEQLIKGLAENGVKIKLVNAAKDFIVEKRENSTTSTGSNNFWGKSISDDKKEIKKAIPKKDVSNTTKKESNLKENGFWGKSITLETKKDSLLSKKEKAQKKKITKKKDFWGKSIKVEKKKDSTTKKKTIKKGF